MGYTTEERRAYCLKNKEKLKAYNKIYQIDYVQKPKRIQDNKDRIKYKYNNNPEYFKEKRKEYYVNNREKVKIHQSKMYQWRKITKEFNNLNPTLFQ